MDLNWWAIEKLLSSTCWEQTKKEDVMNRLIKLEKQDNEFADLEYEIIMQSIYDDQLDALTHGPNYQQNDIIKHLKRLK